MVVTTAAEALKRYETFSADDRLIQAVWNTEQDGRQLACALGVLGDDVSGPRDCPATVMPRWLAQMVPGFFDRQDFADAKDWGLRFYRALDRLDGNVPFGVVHDWHAKTVTALAVEVAELRKRDTAPHLALRTLHERALGGEQIGKDVWLPVLRNAYAYADAYACADACADAYAYACADACADACAYACADACAYAYACADACADAWKRLGDGMVDALNRAAPTAAEALAA